MNRRFSLAKQPWRKLLYIQQQYPDNHTDSSFLSQLKRNSTVQRHSFRKLSFDCTLVSSHLALLSLITLVFLQILYGNNEISIPLTLTMMITSMLLYLTLGTNALQDHKFLEIIKSSMLITLSILTLSPVLKSLSESTSSDSIWSISFWLTCLNVIANDYQFDIDVSTTTPTTPTSTTTTTPTTATTATTATTPITTSPTAASSTTLGKRPQLDKSFSGMNLLTFNVVLLASRLRNNMEVFSFILFSFETASLLPSLAHQLRIKVLRQANGKPLTLNKSMFFYLAMLTSLHIANCGLIYLNFKDSNSTNGYVFGLLTYIVLNFAVLVLAPLYFLMLQKYKDELQGPWDIAKPVL